MAEFWLLSKVAIVIKAIVWSGYAVSGIYMAKTGVQYVKDYKEAMSKEGDK